MDGWCADIASTRVKYTDDCGMVWKHKTIIMHDYNRIVKEFQIDS